MHLKKRFQMKFRFYLPLVFFMGCLHRGPNIELEQGVVIGKNFKDGYTYTYYTQEVMHHGRQIITMPVPHETYVPPVHTIIFKCQHQRVFNIDNRELYEKLNQLDTVTIEYYNLLNGDDEIKDYDFITAYKQK